MLTLLRALFCTLCSWALIAGMQQHCRAAPPDDSLHSPIYAENFEIRAMDGYRLLSVFGPGPSEAPLQRYALVPKGTPLPSLGDDVSVIRTPVERIVALETVTIGYLAALDRLDALVGVASVDYITHPEVRARAASGALQTFASGQQLDVERLLLLQPEVIFTSVAVDASFDLPPRLSRSGLPVVATTSYLEQKPLARAEWLVFLAAFFEAEEEARAFLAPVSERYEALRDKVADIGERPTVLTDAPFSGVWHVAGGRSYTAQLITDAGGHYLWSDRAQSGSVPLDLERVYLRGADADYWINPSFYRSVDALLGADQRFAKFDPVRTGKVFNNTRQVRPGGGNNIWERGVVRPDEILADLVAIFHPEVLPQHEPVYYERLSAGGD